MHRPLLALAALSLLLCAPVAMAELRPVPAPGPDREIELGTQKLDGLAPPALPSPEYFEIPAVPPLEVPPRPSIERIERPDLPPVQAPGLPEPAQLPQPVEWVARCNVYLHWCVLSLLGIGWPGLPPLPPHLP